MSRRLFVLLLASAAAIHAFPAALESSDHSNSKKDGSAAYREAETKYGQWLSELGKQGKVPTAKERKLKHQELFAEAVKIHGSDMKDFEVDTGIAGAARDLTNYNPPAPERKEKTLSEDALARKELRNLVESGGKTPEPKK